MWLMPVVPKNLHTKDGLNATKEQRMLQSKMYLTQTHGLIGSDSLTHKSDNSEWSELGELSEWNEWSELGDFGKWSELGEWSELGDFGKWSELGEWSELCEVNRISRVSLARALQNTGDALF